MSKDIRDYTEFFGLKVPVRTAAGVLKVEVGMPYVWLEEDERAITAACVVVALRRTRYSFKAWQICHFADISQIHLDRAIRFVERKLKGEKSESVMGREV